jgi:hypothetical protein
MEKKKVILTYAVGCFSQKKLDNLKDWSVLFENIEGELIVFL